MGTKIKSKPQSFEVISTNTKVIDVFALSLMCQ